jgi:hypothetical protein
MSIRGVKARYCAALMVLATIAGSISLYGRQAPASRRPTIGLAAGSATKVTSLELRGRASAGINGRTGQPLPDSEALDLVLRFRVPDGYLRVLDTPFSTQRDGFSGSRALFAVTLKRGATGSSSFDEDTYVPAQRAIAARYLLGLLGIAQGPLALKVEPSQAADTLHVTDGDKFDCLVDVDRVTRLPVALRYRGYSYFYTAPSEGAPAAQRRDRSEVTIAFSDRKAVQGVNIPHTILTTAKSLETQETTRVDRFVVSTVLVNSQTTVDEFTKRH